MQVEMVREDVHTSEILQWRALLDSMPTLEGEPTSVYSLIDC